MTPLTNPSEAVTGGEWERVTAIEGIEDVREIAACWEAAQIGTV